MTDSEFADIIVDNDIFPNKRRLFFRLQNLFKRIELKDKTVLDIGGGEGLLSFYAAYKGQRKLFALSQKVKEATWELLKNFTD